MVPEQVLEGGLGEKETHGQESEKLSTTALGDSGASEIACSTCLFF